MNDSDLERWLENDLSSVEQAELEAWLEARESNRRQFVRLQFREQQMRECIRAQSKLERAGDEKTISFSGSVKRRSLWLAAAAVFVATLGWLGTELVQEDEPVAVVQSIRKSDLALAKGDFLTRGNHLILDEGRLALKFDSGAKLAVVGPAELIVGGPNSARLLHGQVMVRVPGKIKGFALQTPVEKVIDLGTAFGVDVSITGETAISVFDGEVKLGNEQRLFAGSAVSVDQPNTAPKEIPYVEGEFAESWQLSFGVEVLSGQVKLATPSQRPYPTKVHDPESLLLFPEREEVELPKGFVLDATKPGVWQRPFGEKSPTLRKATIVDSYLLQYYPGNTTESLQTQNFVGELRFDRPIVGLILHNDLLIQSDPILNYLHTDFSGIMHRGINLNDVVILSEDRHRLKISFDVMANADQIRVLVASETDSIK